MVGISAIVILALANAARPAPCPSPEEIRKALSVSGSHWTTACHVVSGDKTLLAALRKPNEGTPDLQVAAAVKSKAAPVGPIVVTLQGTETVQIRAAAQ